MANNFSIATRISKMEKSTLTPWNVWPKYKLVSRPANSILEQLELARNQFRLLHPDDGTYPSIEISFFNHRLPESSEALLLSWLQNLCANQQVFPLLLNNISGKPPHLVFARIQTTLNHLSFEQKLLSLLSNLSGITSSNIKLTQQFRLTLISDLPGMKFHSAMQFFSGIDICLETEVQHFELMKLNSVGEWKPIQRFHLSHTKHTHKQPWFQPQ